jgi:hypothetical protein
VEDCQKGILREKGDGEEDDVDEERHDAERDKAADEERPIVAAGGKVPHAAERI